MNAIIFAGPTIDHASVAALCGARCRGPAALGDVYRATLAAPEAIGIIDGYFDGTPAIAHKEILWAMAQGIHVFGAASMGALRAAELHPFGMRGVGAIFEAYRDGILEDDDEVALVHGPVDFGYPAFSEPMVDVRATLESARDASMITGDQARDLAAAAKRVFYPERTWARILADAGSAGLGARVLDSLRDWLARPRIGRKRQDAQAMLSEMKRFLASAPGPMQVGYVFEWTETWDRASFRAGQGSGDLVPEAGSMDVAVLDELRLLDGAFRATAERALLRWFDAREAARSGALPLESEPVTDFREARGLWRTADVDAWLARNGAITVRDLKRLAAAEAGIDARLRRIGEWLVPLMLDDLRARGEYESLAARARSKRDLLNATASADAGPEQAGLVPAQLRAWYFEQRLGRAIPEDLDSWLSRHCSMDSTSFYRILSREFLYLSRTGKDR